MPDIDRRALLGLLAGGAALTLRDRRRGDGTTRDTGTATTSDGTIDATKPTLDTMLTDKTGARSLGETFTNETGETRLFVAKFEDPAGATDGFAAVRPQVRDDSGKWVTLSLGMLDTGFDRSVSGVVTSGSDYRMQPNGAGAALVGWWEAEI
jgi:hypothetical protein